MMQLFECDLCNSDMDPDGTCPLCAAQSKIDQIIKQYEIGILHWQVTKKHSKEFFEPFKYTECSCEICRGNPSSDPIYVYLFKDRVVDYQDEYFYGNDEGNHSEEAYTEEDEIDDLFMSGLLS